jgi:hypothetical protein
LDERTVVDHEEALAMPQSIVTRTDVVAAPEPIEALGLFRALPLAVALSATGWAFLAALAYAVYALLS